MSVTRGVAEGALPPVKCSCGRTADTHRSNPACQASKSVLLATAAWRRCGKQGGLPGAQGRLKGYKKAAGGWLSVCLLPWLLTWPPAVHLTVSPNPFWHPFRRPSRSLANSPNSLSSGGPLYLDLASPPRTALHLGGLHPTALAVSSYASCTKGGRARRDVAAWGK